MCGRFVGYRNLDELKEIFPIDRSACEVTANYNVAPSQEILAIFNNEGENWLDKFHWGLVPFWAKDTAIGNRMINARAETVAEKPSFKNAFKKRRCLILSDGFYEWKKFDGKKQPVFLTLPDEKPFAFAGLWEEWNDKGKRDESYLSCTIITMPASDSVLPVHHRMPAIINPEKYDNWLDPDNQNTESLREILSNWTVTELINRPVSKQVNNVRNNEASNIKPLEQMEIKF